MNRKAVSRIAEFRKNAGYTQAELAVFIGVTTNTIQNWEKGEGLAQLEKHLKLCELLNCQLSDLINYVEVIEEREKISKGFSIEDLREIRERWVASRDRRPQDNYLTDDSIEQKKIK